MTTASKFVPFPQPKVIRETVFAAAPVLVNGKPERLSYATLREIECGDGKVRIEIENRSGVKLALDRDAFDSLKLVIAQF